MTENTKDILLFMGYLLTRKYFKMGKQSIRKDHTKEEKPVNKGNSPHCKHCAANDVGIFSAHSIFPSIPYNLNLGILPTFCPSR